MVYIYTLSSLRTQDSGLRSQDSDSTQRRFAASAPSGPLISLQFFESMATALGPSGGTWWRVQLFASALMALYIGQACSQDLGTVYVTAQDYSSEHQAGNIQGLYCDLPDNHNPYACESDYWVAYSATLNPPMSMSLCGKCLQVCTLYASLSLVARFEYQSQNRVRERKLYIFFIASH